jgi:hypothetical protein
MSKIENSHIISHIEQHNTTKDVLKALSEENEDPTSSHDLRKNPKPLESTEVAYPTRGEARTDIIKDLVKNKENVEATSTTEDSTSLENVIRFLQDNHTKDAGEGRETQETKTSNPSGDTISHLQEELQKLQRWEADINHRMRELAKEKNAGDADRKGKGIRRTEDSTSSADVIRPLQVKKNTKGAGLESGELQGYGAPFSFDHIIRYLRNNENTENGNTEDAAGRKRGEIQRTKASTSSADVIRPLQVKENTEDAASREIEETQRTEDSLPSRERDSTRRLSREEQRADVDKQRLKEIIFNHVLNYDANNEPGINKPVDNKLREERAKVKRERFEREFEHYFKEDARYNKHLRRLDKVYNIEKKEQKRIKRFVDYVQAKRYKSPAKKYIAEIHLAFEERRAHIEGNSKTYMGLKPHYFYNWERQRAQRRAKKFAQMEIKISPEKEAFRNALKKINDRAEHMLDTEGKLKGMTEREIVGYKIAFQRELDMVIEQKEQEWRDSKIEDITKRERTIWDLAFTNQYVSIIGYVVTTGVAVGALAATL